MALLWFLYLIGGEPIPMNVHPGDHILDLPLTEVANGSQTNLKNIIADDGFCFFLSPDCPHCQSAMANIRNLFGDDTIVFLFVGDLADVRKFIQDHGGETGNAFIVEQAALVPHRIVTFPAVVTYKNGKCRGAMHGPMTPKNLRILQNLYRGTYKKDKKGLATGP